jgi:hypothetical protein
MGRSLQNSKTSIRLNTDLICIYTMIDELTSQIRIFVAMM